MWDPFLMKKLIKNEICGSMNSAYIYCSLQIYTVHGRKSTFAITVHWTVTAILQNAWKQKKKKKKNKTQLGNADLETKHTFSVSKCKGPLISSYLLLRLFSSNNDGFLHNCKNPTNYNLALCIMTGEISSEITFNHAESWV